MVFWGRHRHVMSAGTGWSHTKIGAGPIPIETDEGWLLIIHGVMAALVDGDTGRMAIYYGAADTTVALAYAYVDELIDFIKKNHR